MRGISTESTITTTAFVATPDNNNQTILYICLGIVALILSILLAILLCKRIRKSFKPFKRSRALKKLRKPVQPEHDPENQELNSLNDNSPDSVTGNLLGDIYETLNENGREYDDTRPDVRSPSSSTIETTATIESQASRGPASDDFSSVLPASNLSTGPSIGDGNSVDRLNVSGELEEEEFVLGGTLPFCSLSLKDFQSLFQGN